MNNIEEDLKRAMARQDPPGELAGKIMLKVSSSPQVEPEAQSSRNKILSFRPKPRFLVWLATAAAAACLVGLFISRSYVASRDRGPDAGSVQNRVSQAGADQSQPPANQPAAPDLKQGERVLAAVAGTRRGLSVRHINISSHKRAIDSQTAEEARYVEEQLKLALAITSAKLGYAQRSIQEADGTAPDREVNR